MIKQYAAYLFRWQMSTPILWGVVSKLGTGVWATVIANFIGGLMFFWVDRFIFTSKMLAPQWEIKENIPCRECGKLARGYRLVKAKNYDRTNAAPEFRCEECSRRKSDELKKRGVKLE